MVKTHFIIRMIVPATVYNSWYEYSTKVPRTHGWSIYTVKLWRSIGQVCEFNNYNFNYPNIESAVLKNYHQVQGIFYLFEIQVNMKEVPTYNHIDQLKFISTFRKYYHVSNYDDDGIEEGTDEFCTITQIFYYDGAGYRCM